MARTKTAAAPIRQWKGAPDLEPMLVPIEDLHLDPANVRKHPEKNLAAIRASLARFGQQKPVVIDADGVVRAGNGTMRAAQANGWTHLAAVRSDLHGSEATAFAVADNRTAELAEWDDQALAETLRSLQSEDLDLDAVGYTGDEVDALCKRLADDLLGDGPAGSGTYVGEGSEGRGEAPDDDEDPDDEDGDDDSEPAWNPAIRFELVFDTVEQQDRWFTFVRWLKSKAEYEAETVAGRLDRFLEASGYAA